MEIYQLKTFVTVARERTITRASELLCLSQPAVSAHIKALESTLGLALFERNARGMSLTSDGAKLMARAEQLLALHQAFLDEARRVRGQLSGTVRIGSIRSMSAKVLGQLLARLSETCPDVQVTLEHATSFETLASLRNGHLDAAFFVDDGISGDDLDAVEIERFGIYLAAPSGWVSDTANPDWKSVTHMPWVCTAAMSCCGRAAERLFSRIGLRPQKLVHVDQEGVTRTLVAGGVGVGFLHEESAHSAQQSGEVELIGGLRDEARLAFATHARRSNDPVLAAVRSAMRDVLQA